MNPSATPALTASASEDWSLITTFNELPIMKDFIMEWLHTWRACAENICATTCRRTLKYLMLCSLSSRFTLILCAMVVRYSAVDRDDRNTYCSSLKRLFLFRCSMNFLLTKTSKSLLMMLRLMVIYWQWGIACLLPHDLFYKQPLNKFARIGHISWLILLRMTNRILSGPVDFWGSRLLIYLETTLAELNIYGNVAEWLYCSHSDHETRISHSRFQSAAGFFRQF